MIIKAADRNLILFVVSLTTFGVLIILVPQFINENQKKIIQGQEAINQTTQEQLFRIFALIENNTAENLKNALAVHEILEDDNEVLHDIFDVLNKTQ